MNIAPILTPVVSPSRKHAVVEFDAKPTPAKIRKRVLENDRVNRGFQYLYTPAPAYDDSKFLLLANEKALLVGGCFFDSITKLSSVHGKSMADELEILFDPFNDGLGYVQFYFNLSGKTPAVSTDAHRDSEPLSEVIVSTHLPYPQAQSSSFDGVRLKKYRWWDETLAGYAIAGLRCRWLFAWFDIADVFRAGECAGFNIARNRPYIDEFSSWNFASGNGSQDALSLGKIYKQKAPLVVSVEAVDLSGDELKIRGEVTAACADRSADGTTDSDKPRPVLTVINPLGDEVAVKPTWKAGAFTLKVPTAGLRGRFRVKPSIEAGPVEPSFVAIDLPEAKRAKDFTMSLTWDSPMCVVENAYTHERLDRDFAAWRALGITRCHWIDYSNWPSFWAHKFWAKGYEQTMKNVGDYTAAACAAAHRNGVEFIADLKTFDLGFNCFYPDKKFKKSGAYEPLERILSSVVPEIAAAQGATFQSNPAWRNKPNLPVGKVVFYSDTPIPDLKPGTVKVLVSSDNKTFTRIKATVTTGSLQRPHQKWTPAGNVPEKTKAKNGYIQVSGFKTSKPYLAVEISGEKFELTHRGFMFAEAFGVDGKPCVLTPATSGNLERGFHFWKGWQGWANQTEAIIQRRGWASDVFAVAFDETTSMPTLLEPSYQETRDIWLGRVSSLINMGVDGVDIRTYCHHNGPMHYLKYAFAKPVLETFKSLYKREPEINDSDYEKIRNIRGDFYTLFMQDASKLLKSHGKKLIAEIESGVEVPASMHVRMQLPLQWKRWVKEGLLDEIHVKWYSPWSLFVHEEVLPFARKHGVKVHVISRCLHQGPSHRFREAAVHTVSDSVRAGFDGYRWYEQQNFMDINPVGYPSFKGPIEDYMGMANQTLTMMS